MGEPAEHNEVMCSYEAQCYVSSVRDIQGLKSIVIGMDSSSFMLGNEVNYMWVAIVPSLIKKK